MIPPRPPRPGSRRDRRPPPQTCGSGRCGTVLHVARQHGAAGDEDGGDVDPGRRHQQAGTFLSQLGIMTRPSNWWAMAMHSVESAIRSRVTREYFMPMWPMAMPSHTAMAGT